ncbi:hypothetical protein MP228_009382 [Amoeboaphelidium protococcarum]|nr:hypothetical protein MP228_009382 [Amoeboaphelidium protococcarum]
MMSIDQYGAYSNLRKRQWTEYSCDRHNIQQRDSKRLALDLQQLQIDDGIRKLQEPPVVPSQSNLTDIDSADMEVEWAKDVVYISNLNKEIEEIDSEEQRHRDSLREQQRIPIELLRMDKQKLQYGPTVCTDLVLYRPNPYIDALNSSTRSQSPSINESDQCEYQCNTLIQQEQDQQLQNEYMQID